LEKIAYLFPGQGSQAVGMGLEFHQEYDEVREFFDMVDEVCKKRISRLCFSGPMEELTRTAICQPAVAAASLAALVAIQKAGGPPPDFAAGHSLGEYAALCAAGALDREATMRLVRRRGELMHADAVAHSGVMYAIVGLSIDEVRDLVSGVEGRVAVANHNTPTQVVISGTAQAVEKAAQLAKKAGAREIPLAVSGPWHSELMARAAKEFASYLDHHYTLEKPSIPVVPNVTATPETDPAVLAECLKKQITSPVLWVDSIRALREAGVDTFVEVGPRRVLTGLVKKILGKDDSKLFSVGDMKGLEAWISAST